MTTFLSECSHEWCTIKDCKCQCHELFLSKTEIKALYRFIGHQYISYDDMEVLEVVKKIADANNQIEKDELDSRPGSAT